MPNIPWAGAQSLPSPVWRTTAVEELKSHHAQGPLQIFPERQDCKKTCQRPAGLASLGIGLKRNHCVKRFGSFSFSALAWYKIPQKIKMIRMLAVTPKWNMVFHHGADSPVRHRNRCFKAWLEFCIATVMRTSEFLVHNSSLAVWRSRRIVGTGKSIR